MMEGTVYTCSVSLQPPLLLAVKHFVAHVAYHTLSGDVAEGERITESLT